VEFFASGSFGKPSFRQLPAKLFVDRGTRKTEIVIERSAHRRTSVV